MNAREKRLALLVALIAGAMIAATAVNRMYLQPKRELDAQLNAARGTLEGNLGTIDNGRFAAQLVAEKVEQTFSTDPAEALSISHARLVRMLDAAGLPLEEGDDGLAPIDPQRLDRSGQNLAVGWSVNTQGRLEQIHRFLYMVQNDPYLSRIDNMTLRAQPRGVDYTLTLRYLTLVLRDTGEAAPVELKPVPRPEGELFDQSWGLIARNIFRPFLPRPVPPPRPVAQPQPQRPQPQPQRPQPQPPRPRPSHVLVSLTETPKGPDIVVASHIDGRTSFSDYSIGDRLAGGHIVMVDVRWLEDPHNEGDYSPSRVIIDIDGVYHAVELNHPLTQRYRIAPDRLPEPLRSQEARAGDAERSDSGT